MIIVYPACAQEIGGKKHSKFVCVWIASMHNILVLNKVIHPSNHLILIQDPVNFNPISNNCRNCNPTPCPFKKNSISFILFKHSTHQDKMIQPSLIKTSVI